MRALAGRRPGAIGRRDGLATANAENTRTGGGGTVNILAGTGGTTICIMTVVGVGPDTILKTCCRGNLDTAGGVMMLVGMPVSTAGAGIK